MGSSSVKNLWGDLSKGGRLIYDSLLSVVIKPNFGSWGAHFHETVAPNAISKERIDWCWTTMLLLLLFFFFLVVQVYESEQSGRCMSSLASSELYRMSCDSFVMTTLIIKCRSSSIRQIYNHGRLFIITNPTIHLFRTNEKLLQSQTFVISEYLLRARKLVFFIMRFCCR